MTYSSMTCTVPVHADQPGRPWQGLSQIESHYLRDLSYCPYMAESATSMISQATESITVKLCKYMNDFRLSVGYY